MITNPMNRMRKIVSKKKRRYQQDGFDLDLSYIRPNMIAMGYPADSYEVVYRNYIGDVSRFLSLKHGDKFYVYNLCVENERQYDGSRFNHNVCAEFSFEDHNPPTIKMVLAFCQHAESQLREMPDRTIVVHCKAGKGRTGVMTCSFLMYYYREDHYDPIETLRFYAQQRTSNEKGVTIPSQRRYVEYFGHLLSNQVTYTAKQIIFTGLLITYEQNQVLHSSLSYTVKSADHRIQYQSFEAGLERNSSPASRSLNNSYSVPHAAHKIFIPPANQQCQIPLEEDVLIEIFVSKTKRGKPEKLCHFWFNTFFLVDPQMQAILSDETRNSSESNLGTLKSCLIPECGHKYLYTMIKKDIDGLHKDKLNRLAPSSFMVSVLFDYVPSASVSTKEKNQNSATMNENLEKVRLKEEDKSNGKSNEAQPTNGHHRRHERSNSSSSRRAFTLYPDCLSDWDSTDSETTANDDQVDSPQNNGNDR